MIASFSSSKSNLVAFRLQDDIAALALENVHLLREGRLS